jgi:tetratricopeptide (TPR) repeat protein
MNRGDGEQSVGYVRSLVELLMELHARDGNRSYREIARRIPSSAGKHTSPGYISEVFRGKRVPSGDMAAAIVQALRGDRDSQTRARRYAEEAASDKIRLSARPDKREPAAPRQLPAAVVHFAGRISELAMLTGLLRGRANTGGTVVISAVSGTAGVGKTALAVYWAHQVGGRFPDGQLYINLRGFDPSGQVMAPAEAVRRFLDALGVPPERIPIDLDAQAALYRSQLAGKRMLVVLDNARDTAQVRPLLPGAPTCLVLVTSRNQLTSLIADGAHPITLDLLTDDEARQLLARSLGADRVTAEPAAIAEIITRCARLPLALAMVAARAAVRPQVELRILAEELHDHRQRWQTLTGDDPTSGVQALFSWSYQILTTAAARLFRLLGLHPGPDLSIAAAASVAGVTISTVRPLLAELTGANLLVEHTPSRYTFHDLLRAYATDLTQRIDPDQQRRTAIQRILDHYLHTAYTADRLLEPSIEPIALTAPQPEVTLHPPIDHQQALDWFTTEYAALLATVDYAATTGFDTHTWQLAWTLRMFFYRRGRWHDLVATSRAAVGAARRLANLPAQAQAHRNLAYAYTQLSRFDEAHTHLTHALDLTTQTGDLTGQAYTHQRLSSLWEQWGNYPQALDHAWQALNLFQAAGHQVGEARALNNVGWYHVILDEHQQALPYCQQALALHQEFDDRDGQAAAWDSLGYAHHHLGHYTQAVTCYQHALDLVWDLGDRYHEAQTLAHLGDTHHATGNPQAAHDAWQHALTIFNDLNHPNADQIRIKLATPRQPNPRPH